jgi:hypothetical protein
VNANALGRGLASRTFAADPSNATVNDPAHPSVADTSIYPETSISRIGQAVNLTTVHSYGLNESNAAMRTTIGHEGIHGSSAEDHVNAFIDLGSPPWDQAHSAPYDAAARALEGQP